MNVAWYRECARKNWSNDVFAHLDGGVDDETTKLENEAGLGRVRLVQRVLRDVSACSLRTSILGTEVAVPVILAPAGHHELAHAMGELATAEAAARTRTIMILSTASSYPLEEVRRAGGGAVQWFQLFALTDTGITRDLICRAEAAGYSALVLTADTQVVGNLEGGMHVRPTPMREGNLTRYDIGRRSIVELFSCTLTWDSLAWIREQTTLPIILKGVQTAEDARSAISCGCDAVYVSNHGGRQLDSAPSSIEMLNEIVESIGSDTELIVDGGFRRGTDVLKAIAVGARCVAVGRPYLYGLSCNGAEGATGVVDVFRTEIERDMKLMGCTSLDELDRSWLRFAPSFVRS